jgi:hypothetical protein
MLAHGCQIFICPCAYGAFKLFNEFSISKLAFSSCNNIISLSIGAKKKSYDQIDALNFYFFN